MSRSRLRLDPAVPLCWEDLDTLRLGFERVRARIPATDHGVQRLLAALRDGFASEELPMIADRCGIAAHRADEVLAELGTAVLAADPDPDPFAPPALRAVLADGGRPVPGLREALDRIEFLELRDDPELGARGAPPPPRIPDLALIVERFVEPSERAQRWLMAGVPHLMLRFSDALIEIGPLVRPEGAPCHACATLERVARDPSLPVVAAQLIGRRADSERPALARLAAVIAEQLLRIWLTGNAQVHRTRHVFPVEGGAASGHGRIERVAPHADCACSALPLPDGSGAVPPAGISRSSPPRR